MATEQAFEVKGYKLSADRLYDPVTHLWVEPRHDELVRIGFDPLGRETLGDVVQVTFEAVGATVRRGEPFGSVEAAKFVGPLVAPLSGVLRDHNEALLADPGLLNEDPSTHWLVQLEPANEVELEGLLQGEAGVAPWFAAEVDRYRSQGAIAE